MPGDPRASRVTTVILIAALVVVVLITGVLSTIAVLMTRNPDMPLGGTPPRRLSIPIHFAPVTGTQAGSCTTPEGVPDDQGQTCYTIAAGVNVNAVRKIEAVQEKSGAYSVRIAFAPAFREQINDLTQEAVNQPIAIVVGEKVVAAPRVAQVITDDSLSIAGSFTKEQADAMVVRLLGGTGNRRNRRTGDRRNRRSRGNRRDRGADGPASADLADRHVRSLEPAGVPAGRDPARRNHLAADGFVPDDRTGRRAGHDALAGHHPGHHVHGGGRRRWGGRPRPQISGLQGRVQGRLRALLQGDPRGVQVVPRQGQERRRLRLR